MPRPFVRAEVWTDVVGNSGVRTVVAIPCLSCQTVEQFEGIVVTPSLTLTVFREWADRAELVVRRVIRLLFDDGSFDEYRIAGLIDGSGADGIVTVTGAGMILDLAEGVNLVRQTTTVATALRVPLVGTPTDNLTTIAAFAPAWWAVGTVTPTSVVDVTVTNATPLAAAIVVATAANTATGVTYELSARRNGTSGYYLDLTVYNAAAAIPDVRTGKNLVQLKRDQRVVDLVTRVVPMASDGERALKDNWWAITAVVANTYIEITDVIGGLSPLVDAGALDGYYVADVTGGTHDITGSSVQSSTTARCTMASTANLVVGQWCQLVANATPDPLYAVDSPTLQTIYGVRLATVPGVPPYYTNHFKNADLRDGSATVPTDWTVTGSGTWTRTTTVGEWVTGGAAYKWPGYTGSNTSLSTVGRTHLDAFAAPLYDYVHGYARMYATAWASLGTASNYVAMYLEGYSPTYVALDGTSPQFDTLNEWREIRWKLPWTSATGGANITFEIFLWNGDAWRGRVDCVYAYVQRRTLASPPDSTQPFFRGSGGAINVQAALGRLRNTTAPKTYTVTLRDLHRFDATIWSGDQVVHGGTCNVTDSDLGATAALRAVSVTTNHLQPLETQVVFSTRLSELTSLLLG